MEGRAKKCVERYWELANKTTQPFFQGATPCMGDHQFREEEIGLFWELPTVCSQMFLKCLYLARIGRPEKFWPVNKIARAVTKWTNSWDKRLARFISYIHHTSEYRQYCYVGNTAQQCRLGLFQDSDFAGDSEHSKSTSGGVLCVVGSHTFVPISWMCKKQTSVSLSWCRFTHVWNSRSRSLGFGDWSISFFTKPNRQTPSRQTLKQTCKNRLQPRTPISIWPTLITFHQAEHILVPMKPWLKW